MLRHRFREFRSRIRRAGFQLRVVRFLILRLLRGVQTSDDPVLLSRFVNRRDEAAFRSLVDRHVQVVYGFALRRVGGDAHLARDVVQEVFVALAREARWVARHPSLTAWLYTTARNVSANVVRTETRRKTRERTAVLLSEVTMNASNERTSENLEQMIDELLDGLEQKDRAVVLLRFIDQKSYREIAEALGTREDAARMRVERALERMRRGLAKRGIASSVALLASALKATTSTASMPVGFGTQAATTALSTSVGLLPTVSTVLQLMSTTKTIAGATAAALLFAAAGSATYQCKEVRSAEARLEEAAKRHTVARNRLAALQERAAKESRSAMDNGAGASPDAQPSQSSPVASAAPPAYDPVADGKAFLQRHPEVAQAFRRFTRGQLIATFGPLVLEMQFTPAEEERFYSLVNVGMWTEFQAPDGRYLRLSSAPELSVVQAQQQLDTLLGPDRAQRLWQYRLNDFFRRPLAAYAGALAVSGEPLTADQTQRLQEVFLKHLSKSASGLQSIDWERVTVETRDLLSKRQQSRLEALRAEEETNSALSERVLRRPPQPQGGES